MDIVSHTTLVELGSTLVSFFSKRGIAPALLSMLMHRLGEPQLVKLISPLLLDGREVGGPMLSTDEIGSVYGTMGMIPLLLEGVLGGSVIS